MIFLLSRLNWEGMVQKRGMHFDLAFSRERPYPERCSKEVRFLSHPFSIFMPKPYKPRSRRIKYVPNMLALESLEQVLQWIVSFLDFVAKYTFGYVLRFSSQPPACETPTASNSSAF